MKKAHRHPTASRHCPLGRRRLPGADALLAPEPRASRSARSCCWTTPARPSSRRRTSPRGVGEHPHRGFETVTIVYQGELEHRDSAGNHGTIGPGDVQWMTAASGVVHEELHEQAFTKRGGVLEMVQLWVNLPAKDKMSPPRYQEILDAQIPASTSTAPGRRG